MTKRDPHPDNELIDQLQEEGSVPNSGARGGNLQRDIGTRAELNGATGEADRERPQASDKPEARNEAKGKASIDRLHPGTADE
jgi:hypothetical protein